MFRWSDYYAMEAYHQELLCRAERARLGQGSERSEAIVKEVNMKGYNYLVSVVFALAVVFMLLTGCSAPGSSAASGEGASEVVAAETIEPALDYGRLTEALRAQGAVVEPAGEIEQPFFSVIGQVTRLNGGELQIFEYGDEAAAKEQAELVSPDGSSVGTSMMSWMATPHFFHSGRLIVLYVGDDEATLGLLEAILGPQFAGRSGS